MSAQTTTAPATAAAPPAPVRAATVAVVAAGGALGSLARYGAALLLPHDPDAGVPWSTFAVNAVGCLLIGALMVLIAGRHPLLRPLLGAGFLGGFTTFSSYAVDAVVLVDRGAYGTAAAYVGGTLATALLGVAAGAALGRWVTRR